MPPASDSTLHWREPDWPAVSVSMVTYNHERHLARALDSVLNQQTNFRFEIVVGDDGSTDRTPDIVRAYARMYPDVVIPILHPKNNNDPVPGRTNNMTNLVNCRGKYTAMLDGDDYWSDPHKLQRQFDVLEAHPEVNLSTHATKVRHLNDAGEEYRPPRRYNESFLHPTTGIYDGSVIFEQGLWFHISSICFRTRAFPYFPPAFRKVLMADYFLILQLSQGSALHYIDEEWSVYVKNDCSLTASGWLNHYILNEGGLLDLQTFESEFPGVRRGKFFQKRHAYQRIWIGYHLLTRRRAYWRGLRMLLRNGSWYVWKYPGDLLQPVYRKFQRFFPQQKPSASYDPRAV